MITLFTLYFILATAIYHYRVLPFENEWHREIVGDILSWFLASLVLYLFGLAFPGVVFR